MERSRTQTVDSIWRKSIRGSRYIRRAERLLNEDRKKALREALKGDSLNFLVTPKTPKGEVRILIFYTDGGNTCYFASALEDIYLRDIVNPNIPFDIMVREGRSIDNLRDIAHSLAYFINENFPGAANRSFKLFGSKNDFLKGKPKLEFLYPTEYTREATEEPGGNS